MRSFDLITISSILFILVVIPGCIDDEPGELDTDGDGIIDEEDPDVDGDGIWDIHEIRAGMDPLDPSDKYQDMHGDGVDNKNEIDTSTDPNDPEDFSNEMKENISKYGLPLFEKAPSLYGKINDADFDDDGMPDHWELQFQTDPQIPDAEEDPDNDGFSNAQECANNTNPHDSFSYPAP
jgi:hypothetical protein